VLDYVHIQLTRRIYIYICVLYEVWNYVELRDLVMMGCLSKLIIVDNLGCPKCKQNSAEFSEKKKIYPQIKRIC
jgi:hypothetical protein